MRKPIRVRVVKGQDRSVKEIRVVFGPHYFVEIIEREGRVNFTLGATHHGFKADASDVGGELEKIIDAVRKKFPKRIVD